MQIKTKACKNQERSPFPLFVVFSLYMNALLLTQIVMGAQNTHANCGTKITHVYIELSINEYENHRMNLQTI